MKKLAFCLLLCLCLVGCQKEPEILPRGSEIKMMVATDLHYLAKDYHDDGIKSQSLYELRDGKIVKYITEITQTFIDTALEVHPDVVLLTGDLTFNGEEASHQELAKMLQPLIDEGIQVLAIPGNHDIRNPYAYSYREDKIYYENTVEAEDFRKIYQNCGYRYASSKDENSLSYLYKISEDIWLLLLDTNGYEYNSGFGLNNIGKIKEGTMEWIKQCYADAEMQDATIYTVSHHSLLKNPYLHSDDYRIQNGKEFREWIATHGTSVHFSGHIHTQSIISETIEGQEVYEITTESLAVSENLYGMVTISPDSFTYEAKGLDVDSWAFNNQIENPELLDFKNYARQFYQDVSYKHFLSNYESIEVEQSVKEKVAYLLAVSNPYYFSGNIDEIAEELMETEEYSTAIQFQDQFSSNYLQRIYTKRALNQRNLTISLNKE